MKQDGDVERFPLFHYKSRRLHHILLCMLGLCLSVSMTNNLALTINCMRNSTAIAMLARNQSHLTVLDSTAATIPDDAFNDTVIETHGGCVRTEHGQPAKMVIVDYGGSLVWDNSVRNFLFKADFWGPFTMIIPAILLLHRLNHKYTFMFWIGNKAVMNLLMPTVSMNIGYRAAFAVRFVLCMGDAFISPSLNSIISSWYPVEERSTAVVLATLGNQFANLIINPVAATLCQSRFQWPAVFYCSGVAGLIWVVCFGFFASSSPKYCKIMTTAERRYLEASLPQSSTSKDVKQSKKVPWKAIATCRPYYAVLCCSLSLVIGFNFINTFAPSYLKDVLYLGVMANGAFNSIPPMFMLGFKLSWVSTMDYLKQKKIITPTHAVRISQAIAFYGLAIFLTLLAVTADCSRPWISLIWSVCACMCLGAHTSGSYTSLLSLAPKYTATLSSISSAVAQLGVYTTPTIVDYFVKTGSRAEWNKVLFTISGILVVAATIFVNFSSGEIQEFAKDNEVPKEETLLEEHKEKEAC